jgi:hypothetical protein
LDSFFAGKKSVGIFKGVFKQFGQMPLARPFVAIVGIAVLGVAMGALAPSHWTLGELVLAAGCIVLVRECTVVFQSVPSAHPSGALRESRAAGWFGGLAKSPESASERPAWTGEERRYTAEADFASQWLVVHREGDSASPSVDQIAHEMLAHAFRVASLKHHPDNGGDPENIRRVYAARNMLLRAVHKA